MSFPNTQVETPAGEVTPAPDAAPAVTPAEPASAPNASPDTSLENDFASTLTELETPDEASPEVDEGNLSPDTPPADTPVPDAATEEPTPAEQVSATPEVSEQPPAEETPPAEGAAIVDPALQEPVAPPTDATLPDTELSAKREAALQDYTERYAIDDDTANAFLASPGDVLPQLAAEMHIGIMENVVSVMQQMIPRYIQTITEQNVRNQKLETAFSSAWPQLNTPELLGQVNQAKLLYRQQYPQATVQQMIKDVGTMVAIKNNLGPQLKVETPAADANGNVDTAPPFVPTVPGAQTPPSTPVQKSDNLFTNFADEELDVG